MLGQLFLKFLTTSPGNQVESEQVKLALVLMYKRKWPWPSWRASCLIFILSPSLELKSADSNSD